MRALRPSFLRCGREWSKRAPKQWAEWCLKLGGRNLYGEPVLRIVWSESETVLVGGVWSKWDDSGNWLGEAVGYQRIRKYLAVRERWVLEMWQPPEAYGTPEAWEEEWKRVAPSGARYQLLPDYPARGDYAQIAVFSDPETGGYSEPTWSDLPGLYDVQLKWKAKAPLERYYELEGQMGERVASEYQEVDEAAGEAAKEMRTDVWESLGMRPRVSLAGLDVPGRSVT